MAKIKSMLKDIVLELRLYSNELEALVKDLIWVASWIGGIVTLYDVFEPRAKGAAYLIFSLSLLMEFAPHIKKKKLPFSKFIHTLFCLDIVCMLLMSFGFLVGIKANQEYHFIIFISSIIAMIYLAIDLILTWLINDDSQSNSIQIALNNTELEQIAKFYEMLRCGNLGSIGEGGQQDE